MRSLATARDRLLSIPQLRLGDRPTPVDDAPRLRDAIGMGARLLIKRDDALSFGFGGNKVRKLALVAADALQRGCDTLITCGGIQSNHCRATAAVAAKLGLACHLVANGSRPDVPTGNALLNRLLGADIHYVANRSDRAPAMTRLAEALRAEGRSPCMIPLGASHPLGALGFARGIAEIVQQGVVPDLIVHASSSGGTQAGLVAGCTLFALPTKVLGVSADDPAIDIQDTVRGLVSGIEDMLGLDPDALGCTERITVDDTFVGEGYGIPSAASLEAQDLAARHEALFVDHWYTAKALAAVVARGREGRLPDGSTVLFWHTGGQVGLFA
jgi:1-aminocyclopropane-1-carboxylate deaminase/D-cysteine desulfhydrase-like pyridoxal-dependent ACC family enzyme